MDFLIELLKESGPLSVVIAFFLWRDWQRERLRLVEDAKREEYHRTTHEDNQNKMTTALVQNAECFRWVGQIIDRLLQLCPQLAAKTCDLKRPSALNASDK